MDLAMLDTCKVFAPGSYYLNKAQDKNYIRVVQETSDRFIQDGSDSDSFYGSLTCKFLLLLYQHRN